MDCLCDSTAASFLLGLSLHAFPKVSLIVHDRDVEFAGFDVGDPLGLPGTETRVQWIDAKSVDVGLSATFELIALTSRVVSSLPRPDISKNVEVELVRLSLHFLKAIFVQTGIADQCEVAVQQGPQGQPSAFVFQSIQHQSPVSPPGRIQDP